MSKEDIKTNIAMSNDAIKLIESYLDKDDVVYEYGSGGSTLWFSPLVKKYYSVEHTPEWYQKLLPHLDDNTDLQLFSPHQIKFDDELDNIDILLDLLGTPHNQYEIKSKSGNTITTSGLFSNPEEEDTQIFYSGGNSGIDWHCFIDYIKSIDRIEEKVDKLFIDGRHRVLSCYYALKYLKPGGIIFFDDWNRSAYHGMLKYCDLIETVNDFDETGYPKAELYPNGTTATKILAVLKKK